MSLQKEIFKKPPIAPASRPTGGAASTLEVENDAARSQVGTFHPATWTDFFETSRDVHVPASDATFRVYQTGSATGPLFVFHHGGGHTALSWSLVARLLKKQTIGGCSILCFDCRGHGDTRTSDDSDLSLERLSQDMANLMDVLYDKQLPSDVVLVGHSMGGAVVVDAATRNSIKNLLGVAIIDVVEGTAMESLAHMEVYLRNRPSRLSSLQAAIQWSLQSGSIKNLESARISVPPQLKPVISDQGQTTHYEWKTNLSASQPYWKGWFQDLSSKFLAVRCARMLVLAGTDRLDTPLTIGQMQGKYQLVLHPESGHAIQEDEPDKLAATLTEFWQRNGPMKVIKRFPIPPKKPVE